MLDRKKKYPCCIEFLIFHFLEIIASLNNRNYLQTLTITFYNLTRYINSYNLQSFSLLSPLYQPPEMIYPQIELSTFELRASSSKKRKNAGRARSRWVSGLYNFARGTVMAGRSEEGRRAARRYVLHLSNLGNQSRPCIYPPCT